jgi:hypothetical protein
MTYRLTDPPVQATFGLLDIEPLAARRDYARDGH